MRVDFLCKERFSLLGDTNIVPVYGCFSIYCFLLFICSGLALSLNSLSTLLTALRYAFLLSSLLSLLCSLLSSLIHLSSRPLFSGPLLLA